MTASERDADPGEESLTVAPEADAPQPLRHDASGRGHDDGPWWVWTGASIFGRAVPRTGVWISAESRAAADAWDGRLWRGVGGPG